MAVPTDFPQANTLWRGWKDRPGHPDVEDLRAFNDGDQQISCWRLTWFERLAVLFTGRVWASVLAQRQPPICIEGSDPWNRSTPDAEAP